MFLVLDEDKDGHFGRRHTGDRITKLGAQCFKTFYDRNLQMLIVSCRIFTHLATWFHVAMQQIIKSTNSCYTHPFSTLTIWS